jgi:hypothetical protein
MTGSYWIIAATRLQVNDNVGQGAIVPRSAGAGRALVRFGGYALPWLYGLSANRRPALAGFDLPGKDAPRRVNLPGEHLAIFFLCQCRLQRFKLGIVACSTSTSA